MREQQTAEVEDVLRKIQWKEWMDKYAIEHNEESSAYAVIDRNGGAIHLAWSYKPSKQKVFELLREIDESASADDFELVEIEHAVLLED